jgi:hypothetical protein
MQPTYYSLEQLISMIDEPNRSRCMQLLIDNQKIFQTVQGSAHNHQYWSGGYYDHVHEIMNVAVLLYGSLSSARPLPFSLSDALLVTYLHDVEKPWKYALGPDGQSREIIPAMKEKEAQIRFRFELLKKYDIVLSPDQENGMRYVEGESKDYSNHQRVAGPLAAFCHLCDVTSARIWFDCPKEHDDEWSGAKRVRDAD